MVSNRQDSYLTYLTGNSWRCAKSPTGAHHWIIRGRATCIYCLMEKEIDPKRILIDIKDSPLLAGKSKKSSGVPVHQIVGPRRRGRPRRLKC